MGKAALPLFNIAEWRNLVILDLSRTGVTAASVRTLILDSTSIKVLQLVACARVTIAAILRILQLLRHDAARATARKYSSSLKVLDVWDIDGLHVDYKHQNSKVWMYESFCRDNKSLRTLLEYGEDLQIAMNIWFCQGERHETTQNIMYHSAARQTWGLSPCEVCFDQTLGVHVCDTCMLRKHNDLHNIDHRCRETRPITFKELEEWEAACDE